MQCSINAISVASLYVAVRRPVSRIATTRCPRSSGSVASPSTALSRCRHQRVELHQRIMARGIDVMGKLVRDKIPDIIRATGRTPRVRILPAEEYRSALHDKLHEEVAELLAALDSHAVVEEAADVLEVLTAIVAEHGATLDTIVDVAGKKRAERGGFDMRLWLESVDPDPATT